MNFGISVFELVIIGPCVHVIISTWVEMV